MFEMGQIVSMPADIRHKSNDVRGLQHCAVLARFFSGRERSQPVLTFVLPFRLNATIASRIACAEL
jgi:hypothetical protein